MTALAPWLTTAQVAELCGVDRAEAYHRLLPQLDFRRIGVRGGAAPWGRLIRVERGSVLRLCGHADIPAATLPRWVTLPQAADYYQVSPHLIRRMIAYEQLDARRIGTSGAIRIDRDSLLELGRVRVWQPS
ncbi:helix-turn-helix domain-containing protein [Mycobacterium sp. CVI_P3]|uniref:Helix-turn-helix domain-containing protein n=1 Tax=Mycobacterium pinniadriaticum TaxID=2994102 RepID=A0ABT3SNM4_9MYCO|nr:helix-turn-helix domain-containing protein [Mycobacterium pinniadriaticum]MCX2934719.1 helix-turn-helix domain-containing protein [Mycobacterium pinniadriaticum]MCX2941129.1 helix-turn-helix domain-containing protein [Mycobacterium pinniadriaticum]